MSHDAVLFCNEGSQHVKRASSRVTQPPGGRSTLSLFGGGDDAPAPVASGRRRFTQDLTQNPTHFGQGAPLANNTKTNVRGFEQPPVQPMKPQPVQQHQQQQSYSLFCNEGSQLRNRPAKKVLQPPGGTSSIFG